MTKKYTIFLTALLLTVFQLKGYCTNKSTPDDLLLFRKVAQKLMDLKTVCYHYSRAFSYPSEKYYSKSEGQMYVDFGKENDLVGFRYQYRDSVGFSIFNNSGIFDGDIQNNTIGITNKIEKSGFEGRSAIYNSIITLRALLPRIIEDHSVIKHVTDTLIGNKSFYLLKFETQNKFPNYLGTGFSTTTQELIFYHRLLVDKKTLLPLTLLQSKSGSDDLNRTDFTEIKLNPLELKENSWYYSSYLDQYKPEKQQAKVIIKVGQVAPEISLTNQKSGLKNSLSEHRGKLVLLEFWIKNCGYCIEAVSKLNAIDKRHLSADFKLLAINTEDSENSVELFIRNHQVKYTILRGNNLSINKNYGITSFPQVVLIDKTGVVIYSGQLDVQKIEELISKNI